MSTKNKLKPAARVRCTAGLGELNRVKQCRRIIRTAERWAKQQVMPESHICMAALKDLRRVLFAQRHSADTAGLRHEKSMNTPQDPEAAETAQITEAPAVDLPRLVRLDVLTPEFLYRALRPDASWEINADKPHWEYEAWKLQSAIIRQLEANSRIIPLNDP